MVHIDGGVQTRHHPHRMPTQPSPLRPRWSDLQLALWVVGLLMLMFGIAGLYGAAVDYDATAGDETVPATAVLAGGAIVVVAATVTLVSFVRDLRGSAALRRRSGSSRR